MVSARYCIWAVLLAFAAPVSAQPAATTTHGFTIFVGGTVAGREQVTVTTRPDGLTITSEGRLSGSSNIVLRRAEVRYRTDWTPEVLEIEATVNGGDTILQTSFDGSTAMTQGVDGGQKISQTSTVPAQVLILPNVFFGSYAALARRLASAGRGDEFAAFLGAGTLGTLRLDGAGTERMQIGTAVFDVLRYQLTFTSPRGANVVNLYADPSGSLLRVSIPSMGVDVMREDLASSTARTIVFSNPGDAPVNIPAAGFNLGATITRPASGGARLPAVILLAGAGADERDGVVSGVPVLGQLAGALADAGFVAVRYDKRGHGQSGGRAESATLADHAEDAVAVFRWLASRGEIDRDRIAIVGHNEGAWAALLAANRERRIAAVVTIASPAVRGTERVLEQQRHVLEQSSLSPAERVARIALQEKINGAVMSGRGWDEIPPELRAQAETPWFQSLLSFDPQRVLRDLRQPLLVMHGELDAQVPVSHADRLGELAKSSRSRSVAVITVRGVNHLLTPAATGDVAEYPTLQDRTVSRDVTMAIADWLTKTFQAVR